MSVGVVVCGRYFYTQCVDRLNNQQSNYHQRTEDGCWKRKSLGGLEDIGILSRCRMDKMYIQISHQGAMT